LRNNIKLGFIIIDDNHVKRIVERDITGDEPEEIYVIEYGYDDKGRRNRQTVWNSRDDDYPQCDGHS